MSFNAIRGKFPILQYLHQWRLLLSARVYTQIIMSHLISGSNLFLACVDRKVSWVVVPTRLEKLQVATGYNRFP